MINSLVDLCGTLNKQYPHLDFYMDDTHEIRERTKRYSICEYSRGRYEVFDSLEDIMDMSSEYYDNEDGRWDLETLDDLLDMFIIEYNYGGMLI